MSQIKTIVVELIAIFVLVGVLVGLDALRTQETPSEGVLVQQDEEKKYTYESTTTTKEHETIPTIMRDYRLHVEMHIETPDLTMVADDAVAQVITDQLNGFVNEQVEGFTERHIPDRRWLSAVSAFPSNTQIFYPQFEPVYHITAKAYHPMRTPNILSVGFNEWYDAGLAHPVKNGYTFTFDLRTGIQLIFDDLFLTGDAFTQAVVDSLQSQGGRLPGSAYRCCGGTSTDFLISEEGLAFLLDQSRVGGNVPVTEVVVPWDVLMPYIKSDGLLGAIATP